MNTALRIQVNKQGGGRLVTVNPLQLVTGVPLKAWRNGAVTSYSSPLFEGGVWVERRIQLDIMTTPTSTTEASLLDTRRPKLS